MITILLVFALNSVDLCRPIGDALAGCVAYHGPTVCQAAIIWMCTAGGDESKVGLVAHPWTWPAEWRGSPPE